MAKQTRTVLKSFFQTGDVPTEGQYVDLIDSNLNLSENNTGDIQLTGDITASGNISASNTSGTHILGGDLTVGDDLFVTDDIHLGGTNSAHKILQRDSDGNLRIGNDSSLQSGAGNTEIEGLNHITASSDEIKIEATDGPLNLVGNVTASNSISASGIISGRTGSFDNYSNANFANANITSSAVSASNNIITNDITASELLVTNIELENLITHDGDGDTKISFTNDKISLKTGNRNTAIGIGGVAVEDGNITASIDSVSGLGGNISASGDIAASRLVLDSNVVGAISNGEFMLGNNSVPVQIKQNYLTVAPGETDGHITASGNISARGNVFANSATVQGGVEVAMGGTSSHGIKILGGGGGTQAFLTNINGLILQPTTQDPSQPDTPHVTIGVGGHITASGDISASGDIIANNINQSVKTTNSPTFASLILSDIAIDYRPTRDISGSLAYDATQTFNMGPKYGARLTVTGMPNVGADQLVTGIVVKNERVREHTIILANSNSAFTVQPFGIKSGQFVLNLRTGFKEYTASDFPSGFVINIALFGV